MIPSYMEWMIRAMKDLALGRRKNISLGAEEIPTRP
jgi:hypothetical protein